MKNKKTLRQLFPEMFPSVLREDQGVISPKEDGEDSLDDQLDKYLLSYEKEAKAIKSEGYDWKLITRRFITEAGDDEEEKDDEGGEDADAPVDDGPKKGTIDSIDVETFVDGVVRLIDNYENLLEVKNTILRRAFNFLLESYDEEVTAAFKEELETTHGLEIGQSAEDRAAEEFPAPAAGAAGPLGGGGALVAPSDGI